MPQPHRYLLGIFFIGIVSFALSQPLWAQSIEFDHQVDNTQAAQDHLKLGIDFYLTHELDAAIQQFREAQQHRPEYANAHWNLGVGLAKLGDLDGAVTAWSQAERLDPSAFPTRYNLSALVTYNYGIALLQRGNLLQAITEWEQALRIQPDLAEVPYALGLAYQTKGNTILAQRYFEQANFWAPDWADTHNQLGMAYYQNGDYTKARDYVEQAIRLKPEDARAYANLGLVQLAEGHLTEAEHAFTTAISFDSTLPQAHFNLGLLYAKKQDWHRAVHQLHTTIVLNPKLADAHALLGSALSSMGDWPRAIKEWQTALSLNPHGNYAYDLHYNMGMAYRVINANSKAIKAFQHATHLHPNSAQAHFQLGVAYETRENWTKASDHFLVAIRQEPNWALPYFKLGLVRYNQGFLDAAIESYQRAITLHPDYAEAQYQLGVTLRAARRPQESLSHIRLAAEQGMGEAQDMLATMLANGSGTERNIVQAMRWWFKAASGSPYEDGSDMARAQLSRLRSWAFSHQGNPDYIQQVSDGFQAIQTDIQQRFNTNDFLSSSNSVGVALARTGQRDDAISVLLEEAFALHQEAHDFLEHLVQQEEAKQHHTRILHYFSQTAKEGSPQSCKFLKTLSDRHIPLAVGLNPNNSGSCPQ